MQAGAGGEEGGGPLGEEAAGAQERVQVHQHGACRTQEHSSLTPPAGLLLLLLLLLGPGSCNQTKLHVYSRRSSLVAALEDAGWKEARVQGCKGAGKRIELGAVKEIVKRHKERRVNMLAELAELAVSEQSSQRSGTRSYGKGVWPTCAVARCVARGTPRVLGVRSPASERVIRGGGVWRRGGRAPSIVWIGWRCCCGRGMVLKAVTDIRASN